MVYTEQSKKSVDEVIKTFEEVISDYKFGILHIHNVKETLISKGVDYNHECRILDICNPNYAKMFLEHDTNLSVVLPCKITVYEKEGETNISMNSLVQLVDDINPDMTDEAINIQDTLLSIIQRVK